MALQVKPPFVSYPINAPVEFGDDDGAEIKEVCEAGPSGCTITDFSYWSTEDTKSLNLTISIVAKHEMVEMSFPLKYVTALEQETPEMVFISLDREYKLAPGSKITATLGENCTANKEVRVMAWGADHDDRAA